MTIILPAPKTIDNIVRLFSENPLINTKSDWLLKGLKIDSYVHAMETGARIQSDSISFHKLNMYFLYRSLNQANEACNKLWSTMELYRQMISSRPLFSRFNREFLSSTSIPSLHYANMSSMISMLTLFGVCPWVKKGQKIRYYNILRTENGLLTKERRKYLIDTFGNAKVGWHQEVIQMYEGLSKLGVRLPKINLTESKNLLNERNRVQYDILCQTTMKGMLGTATYFAYLDKVIESLQASIMNLKEVLDPLPNALFTRFESLRRYAPTLMNDYLNRARH